MVHRLPELSDDTEIRNLDNVINDRTDTLLSNSADGNFPPNPMEGQDFFNDVSKLSFRFIDGVWVENAIGVVPIRMGGTGATDPEGIRNAAELGDVAMDDNVPVIRGGTGGSTPETARAGLQIKESSALGEVLPIAEGGTGAITPAGIRSAAGLGDTATDDVIPLARGGTGATTAAGARVATGTLTQTQIQALINNTAEEDNVEWSGSHRIDEITSLDLTNLTGDGSVNLLSKRRVQFRIHTGGGSAGTARASHIVTSGGGQNPTSRTVFTGGGGSLPAEDSFLTDVARIDFDGTIIFEDGYTGYGQTGGGGRGAIGNLDRPQNAPQSALILAPGRDGADGATGVVYVLDPSALPGNLTGQISGNGWITFLWTD